MTSAHEPVLHALSVEPRTARPGETVCVIFRTRNLGTSPSPPGTVAFLLGDGLEVLDHAEVAVASVAPGEDVVAAMRARLAEPLDDRTELAVQAVLRVPDAVLGTNVCALRVRSRPVLDGAASGTFVESLDAARVRVRAIVTNEGDGAARDVRIEVPPPVGCVRADGDGAAALELERLDTGESVTVVFEARIVAPVVVLRADGGEVLFSDGRRCALPVREVVVLEPVIAPPALAVRPSRRSVDVAIDVRNDGWVDARDVRVRIALTGPLRAIDGSMLVDGVHVGARGARRVAGGDPAFARVERSGGASVVVVPVPARSTVRVAFAATFPGGCAGGTIVAGAGQHEVAVPFVPELVREVRLRLIDVPRTVVPGGDVRVLVEVVNAGDRAESLFLCVAGSGIVVAPDPVSRTVASGAVALVELPVRVNEITTDGGPLRLSVVACDVERERVRAELVVPVRTRPALCADEVRDDDDESMPAVVHAALRGPDDVASGAPFTVRVEIDVEDAVEVLLVRVRDVGGAAYVPGSTSVDGRPLLDRGGVSPLAEDGLSLRDVPAGTRVTATLALLADPIVCDETLIVEAVLGVEGEERACAPIAVHVRGRQPFAAQPGGLPYHVDACVLEGPTVAACDTQSEAVSAAAVWEELVVASGTIAARAEDAFTFGLRLDPASAGEIARLLHGPVRGLTAHVLALRVFFPSDETSRDPIVAAALAGVRSALHDVLDRLFVKLRIPGFDIACDDIDDIPLRRAMIALLERLVDASPGSSSFAGATVRITRERVREILTAFADAPYGAPAALRALVAMLPAHCEFDPALGTALARYACALDDVLARYDGVPLELFDDALARASDRALDDAAVALAASLDERAAPAELAC